MSGGGVKGLIGALFLYELCKRTGKQPRDLFDYFIGTSTGGIICLLLNSPKMYTTEDVVNFYVGDDAKSIFKPRFLKFPWEALKYPSNQIESVLKYKFGEDILKDCSNPVTVTAYDTVSRDSLFINSFEDKCFNLKMWECARATSAAPTFFEPFSLNVMSLCDGGLFANNPTFFGYIEAKKLFPNDELIVVSLGTGSSATAIPYKSIIKWNIIDWAINLFSLVTDGQSDTTHFALKKLLPQERYFPFDLKLTKNMDEMDRIDNAFLNNLITLTKEYLAKEWKDELNRLVSEIGSDN